MPSLEIMSAYLYPQEPHQRNEPLSAESSECFPSENVNSFDVITDISQHGEKRFVLLK